MDSADVYVNVSDEHNRLASPAGDGIGGDRPSSVELLRGISGEGVLAWTRKGQFVRNLAYINGSIADDRGISTHYFLEGPAEGELIVFVHGLGHYNFCFQSIAMRFREKGFRTLVYDNIGLGHSYVYQDSINKSNFSGNGHVNQLRNLLEQLELTKSKYTIVCHSMGGAITLLYASLYADEIKNIIFMTPAGLMDKRIDIKLIQCLPTCLHNKVRSVLRAEYDSRKLPFVYEDFVDQHHPMIQTCEQALLAMHDNNELALEAFFQSVLHFPLFGLDSQAASLAKTDVRVMILWADKDTTTPMTPNLSRWTRMFEGRAHPWEYHVFHNASHCFYMEREKEVVDKILAFSK